MATFVAFIQAHPLLCGLLAIVAFLSLIGLWYVIAHHLQAIVISMLCAAGTAAGAIVLWRGIGGDMVDLISIGVFLMVIFPVIYSQAIRREKKAREISITQIPGVARPLPAMKN